MPSKSYQQQHSESIQNLSSHFLAPVYTWTVGRELGMGYNGALMPSRTPSRGKPGRGPVKRKPTTRDSVGEQLQVWDCPRWLFGEHLCPGGMSQE